MLWPWPLTYDLEKLIRSGHYHYQCVYQIWEQSIQWFLSYRVNTIAGGGRRAAGGGRLRRKTITSPDPSDTGDIITISWHGVTIHSNMSKYFSWNTSGCLVACHSGTCCAYRFINLNIHQIAKTLESTSIRHRSDTSVSDRCLMDADWRVVAIQCTLHKLDKQNV